MRKPVVAAVVLALVLGMAVAVAGCGDRVVAIVNGEQITRSMVEQRARVYIADYEAQNKVTFDETKNKALLVRYTNLALNDLIEQTLLVQDAKKKGIKVTDSQVESSIKVSKELLTQMLGKAGYEKYMKTLGMSEAELKTAARNEQMASAALRLVTDKVTVSDQEISQYYQEHKQDYAGKSLEQIKAQVKADVLKVKKQEAKNAYLELLRKQAKVEIKN